MCERCEPFAIAQQNSKTNMLLLLLLLLVAAAGGQRAQSSPTTTVCLNMIVKDEAGVILRALESARPMITDWVIVDTGSTDGTQDLIREFFEGHGLAGHLLESTWHDFATNRNEALEQARRLSRSDYVLFLDADDYFRDFQGWPVEGMKLPQYTLRIQHGDITHGRTMLVRRESPCAWHGVIHEYIACTGSAATPALEKQLSVYLQIGEGGSRSQDSAKYAKDAAILEEALLKEPENTRYAFYLAQSYRDAGQPQKALSAYLRSASMPGAWREEVFWAWYQAAQLMEQLQWPAHNISQAYLEAHARSPRRLEALHGLAQYYREQNNFAPCFVYAMMGQTLLSAYVQPTSGILFKQSWIYDYGILDELSICAYYVGEYQTSLDVSDSLLRQGKLPQSMVERVQNNRAFAAKVLHVK